MLCPDFAKYNKTEHKIYWKNGSTMIFRPCEKDQDLTKIQGIEYDLIFIDEATNLSEFQLKSIAACCRGTNGFPKHIYYTCNPGGQGHGYIKRIFIDRRFNENEIPEEYSFTQALVYDNEALMNSDPTYVNVLKALPYKLRKAWLEGSWDIFEGQFFEEFIDNPDHYLDKQWTHVIEPFNFSPSWKIYRSYDFGYAKPFSCAWWAVDYDRRLYRILELYGCTGEPNEGVKWTPSQQFKRIQDIERQHPWLRGKVIHGVADPAIWNSESGESVADTAAKFQIFFDKGDNQRIPGWMQMHYRMMFDENGIPMMYIFKNCKAFIRTIPLMIYDEHEVEDLDTKLEDHVADETRYMCMMDPIAPRVPEVQMPIREDPLNQRTPKVKGMYTIHG